MKPPEVAGLLLGGQALQLLPQRALWWPAQQAIVVADIHLGKDAVFRRQGLALPRGAADEDLNRLSTLIRRYQARQLIVLGDFLHAAPQDQEDWMPALIEWRTQHASLALKWLLGNHDRRVALLARSLDAQCLSDPDELGGLLLCHEPPETTRTPSLSGHWHPVLQLRTAARIRKRLPAFWLAGQRLVLPAFGELTGGHPIPHRAADRSWVTDGTEVFEWPPSQPPAC